jgi:hypothetical protein
MARFARDVDGDGALPHGDGSDGAGDVRLEMSAIPSGSAPLAHQQVPRDGSRVHGSGLGSARPGTPPTHSQGQARLSGAGRSWRKRHARQEPATPAGSLPAIAEQPKGAAGPRPGGSSEAAAETAVASLDELALRLLERPGRWVSRLRVPALDDPAGAISVVVDCEGGQRLLLAASRVQGEAGLLSIHISEGPHGDPTAREFY